MTTDRHKKPARKIRDSEEEFSYQDQAAEALGMAWTEWARDTLQRQARKDFAMRNERRRLPRKKRKPSKAEATA